MNQSAEPETGSERYAGSAPDLYSQPDAGHEELLSQRPLVPPQPVVVADVDTREGDEPVLSDRVRWGPIWAGFVVAVAVLVLLQLGLLAVDITDLDLEAQNDLTRSTTFWTIAAAGVAFFVGGLVAGATAKWRHLSDGMVQGIVLWALITVALAVAAGFAVGTLATSVGGTLGRLAVLRDSLTSGGTPDSAAVDDARQAAADACLFLGITVATTALGALIGAKLWPPRRRQRTGYRPA